MDDSMNVAAPAVPAAPPAEANGDSVAHRSRRTHYKGVSKTQHMWKATIFARGTMVDIGFFDTEEGAARGYDKAVLRFRRGAHNVSELNFADSQLSDDDHAEQCEVCDEGGIVLCCDKCSLVFHLDCLKPALESVPSGEWRCPLCTLDGAVAPAPQSCPFCGAEGITSHAEMKAHFQQKCRQLAAKKAGRGENGGRERTLSTATDSAPEESTEAHAGSKRRRGRSRTDSGADRERKLPRRRTASNADVVDAPDGDATTEAIAVDDVNATAAAAAAVATDTQDVVMTDADDSVDPGLPEASDVASVTNVAGAPVAVAAATSKKNRSRSRSGANSKRGRPRRPPATVIQHVAVPIASADADAPPVLAVPLSSAASPLPAGSTSAPTPTEERAPSVRSSPSYNRRTRDGAVAQPLDPLPSDAAAVREFARLFGPRFNRSLMDSLIRCTLPHVLAAVYGVAPVITPVPPCGVPATPVDATIRRLYARALAPHIGDDKVAAVMTEEAPVLSDGAVHDDVSVAVLSLHAVTHEWPSNSPMDTVAATIDVPTRTAVCAIVVAHIASARDGCGSLGRRVQTHAELRSHIIDFDTIASKMSAMGAHRTLPHELPRVRLGGVLPEEFHAVVLAQHKFGVGGAITVAPVHSTVLVESGRPQPRSAAVTTADAPAAVDADLGSASDVRHVDMHLRRIRGLYDGSAVIDIPRDEHEFDIAAVANPGTHRTPRHSAMAAGALLQPHASPLSRSISAASAASMNAAPGGHVRGVKASVMVGGPALLREKVHAETQARVQRNRSARASQGYTAPTRDMYLAGAPTPTGSSSSLASARVSSIAPDRSLDDMEVRRRASVLRALSRAGTLRARAAIMALAADIMNDARAAAVPPPAAIAPADAAPAATSSESEIMSLAPPGLSSVIADNAAAADSSPVAAASHPTIVVPPASSSAPASPLAVAAASSTPAAAVVPHTAPRDPVLALLPPTLSFVLGKAAFAMDRLDMVRERVPPQLPCQLPVTTPFGSSVIAKQGGELIAFDAVACLAAPEDMPLVISSGTKASVPDIAPPPEGSAAHVLAAAFDIPPTDADVLRAADVVLRLPNDEPEPLTLDDLAFVKSVLPRATQSQRALFRRCMLDAARCVDASADVAQLGAVAATAATATEATPPPENAATTVAALQALARERAAARSALVAAQRAAERDAPPLPTYNARTAAMMSATAFDDAHDNERGFGMSPTATASAAMSNMASLLPGLDDDEEAHALASTRAAAQASAPAPPPDVSASAFDAPIENATSAPVPAASSGDIDMDDVLFLGLVAAGAIPARTASPGDATAPADGAFTFDETAAQAAAAAEAAAEAAAAAFVMETDAAPEPGGARPQVVSTFSQSMVDDAGSVAVSEQLAGAPPSPVMRILMPTSRAGAGVDSDMKDMDDACASATGDAASAVSQPEVPPSLYGAHNHGAFVPLPPGAPSGTTAKQRSHSLEAGAASMRARSYSLDSSCAMQANDVALTCEVAGAVIPGITLPPSEPELMVAAAASLHAADVAAVLAVHHAIHPAGLQLHADAGAPDAAGVQAAERASSSAIVIGASDAESNTA